jgi:hypothetical protein
MRAGARSNLCRGQLRRRRLERGGWPGPSGWLGRNRLSGGSRQLGLRLHRYWLCRLCHRLLSGRLAGGTAFAEDAEARAAAFGGACFLASGFFAALLLLVAFGAMSLVSL